MSKELYEEALADIRRVTEVAEDNAKRAVIEAVTPRIRELIDRELFNESFDDDRTMLGDQDVEDDLLVDDGAMPPVAVVDPQAVAPAVATTVVDPTPAAITLPDAEGKVTLDLDALDASEHPGVAVSSPAFGDPVPDEYELGLESLDALKPVLISTKVASLKQLESRVSEVRAFLESFVSRDVDAKANEQIARMISRVEDMYDYVQESAMDAGKRTMFERKLETYFQSLTKLQEQKMSKKQLKDLIKEDDAGEGLPPEADAGGGGELTLKLSGLPADVDLDTVGVDLVAGDDEGADDDVADADVDVGDDEGGDLDLDLGGDDQDGDETTQFESIANLSDDTIVEIDENMLRSEIVRMRKLREAASNPDVNVQAVGGGVDADAMDDFGGGSEEGEPFLDGEVTTESEEMPLEMEADEVYESARRRLAFEQRIQARAKTRAAALKKEAARATGAKKVALAKEYTRVAKRFNESLVRVKKIKIAESANKAARFNSAPKQSAESLVGRNLRKQLAATNLFNTKLVYANKLLQNESLTKAQKAHVLERLDDAKNEREAKLVYESLVKTLTGGKATSLRESRARSVIGSASRPVRSGGASQTLTEGFETERWAQLAGITNRK